MSDDILTVYWRVPDSVKRVEFDASFTKPTRVMVLSDSGTVLGDRIYPTDYYLNLLETDGAIDGGG